MCRWLALCCICLGVLAGQGVLLLSPGCHRASLAEVLHFHMCSLCVTHFVTAVFALC